MDIKKLSMDKLDFTLLFKKKNALFIIGLVGIFMLFISDILASEIPNSESMQESETISTSLNEAQQYADYIEEQLIEAVSNMQGVGKTQIMITIETPIETIYAKNVQNDNETTINEDGTHNTQSSYQNEHIIIQNSNNDMPLIEMQLLPEIKGVAIICEGGDDITVVSRITELVSVVLGVPTNRICVTKMNLTEE